MASYITHFYLQPTLRVQKGAYGTGMHAVFPNSLSLYTYRDPDFRSSLREMDTMVDKIRSQIDEDTLQVAKTEALGQMQQQFKLLEPLKEQAHVLEKLILSEIDIKVIERLQQAIIHTSCKELDEKLALVAYLIDNSHLSICTDPKRTPIH